MNRTDAIIIGGGVAGLMSARELAAAGMRVVLLERQAIGKESSWAGGGILSPLHPWRVPEPVTALCQWSQAVYPRLAEDLKGRTGIDPEWLQSGLLFCDCDDPAGAAQWAAAHGSRFERLAADEMARLEPGIRAAAGNPLLLPDIGQVRNPRLLRALRQDLALRGVEVLEHHPVDEIRVERGRVAGVVCRQETLSAEAYVLAVGAWSGLLARNSGLPDLPIVPVKGEMLVFDSPPGLLSHMVLSRGRYLIPRKDGRILAGSTVENAQFNKSATSAAGEVLRSFACDLLPALRQCAVEKHWAGLRPGSPGGVPVIGAHPETANLYFNCGHFRNGFVMAPASARLLADHVLRRPAIVAPEPYLPRGGN
jgi:glycine oxidase